MSSATQTCVAIIDDDDSVCRSLSRLLRVVGIQAVSYPSAERFLSDSKRPRFDCLVIDIQLSDMSGSELNRRLTALGLTTPVIFNTASDEPDIREQALQTGCAAYLHKIESGKSILAAISQAIHSGSEKGRS